jgi:hypothetical protein
LVHGFPQHSLTWHTIGPILAQNCMSIRHFSLRNPSRLM